MTISIIGGGGGGGGGGIAAAGGAAAAAVVSFGLYLGKTGERIALWQIFNEHVPFGLGADFFAKLGQHRTHPRMTTSMEPKRVRFDRRKPFSACCCCCCCCCSTSCEVSSSGRTTIRRWAFLTSLAVVVFVVVVLGGFDFLRVVFFTLLGSTRT
jgi:hypothetical protein